MSINVEQIGSGLVVQHCVAEVAEPTYFRVNSISEVLTANGRTQVNVIWELVAEKIDENRTRYTNRVTAHPTDAFMAFLQEHGIKFEDAVAAPGRRQRPQ
jgi:spore cortex formation protein SpoVR/YcgB (stage V sporulation)